MLGPHVSSYTNEVIYIMVLLIWINAPLMRVSVVLAYILSVAVVLSYLHWASYLRLYSADALSSVVDYSLPLLL